MNQMKLIDKHYEWMEKGEMDAIYLGAVLHGGNVETKYKLTLWNNFPFSEGIIPVKYTDTLQNIVLLICAMEGELK